MSNLDIDSSELALPATARPNVGIRVSEATVLFTGHVLVNESVLAAGVNLELDADDIKLAEDAADVTRLALERLRRAADDVTALPLAATSAAFASSMSRSLSSLR